MKKFATIFILSSLLLAQDAPKKEEEVKEHYVPMHYTLSPVELAQMAKFEKESRKDVKRATKLLAERAQLQAKLAEVEAELQQLDKKISVVGKTIQCVGCK